MNLRVAACEYPISRLASWGAWEGKLRTLCAAAAGQGAQLLVFPEYAGMELTSLLPAAECADLQRSIRGLQTVREAYVAAHRQIAEELGVSILAGSLPWECDGGFVNRAWLCTPDGRARAQDKIVMTRFEREQWIIRGGTELRVFDLPGGVKAGVLICYDSEFPLLARQLCEAGADVLLVPSCTDTEAGYHRVLLSCRARALEQQCFVIQSPTAGLAEWSPAVDVNTGKAGAFAPVDTGFPPDGVLACGAAAETAPWLIVDLPLGRLGPVRRHGQVRNAADWPEQFSAVLRVED
jgi:predicted amidohydrolase